MFKSLSKRERYIVIGVIAAVALLVLDSFVLTPLSQQRSDLADQRDKVTIALRDADETFHKQTALKKTWADIQSGGLRSNRSNAESQAQQAVLEWARQAGVSVVSLKPDRDTTQNQFQVISFHITGTGTMLALSKLLNSLESAAIPVRLNDMQITPKREASDDLSMQLSISTLALLPDAKAAGSVTR